LFSQKFSEDAQAAAPNGGVPLGCISTAAMFSSRSDLPSWPNGVSLRPEGEVAGHLKVGSH